MECFKVIGKLVVFALLLVSSVSRAEIVNSTFTAHGLYYYSPGGGPLSYDAESDLSVGTLLTGSFNYDTSIPATSSWSNPPEHYGEYDTTTGIGMSVSSPTGYTFVNNLPSLGGYPMSAIFVTDSDPGSIYGDEIDFVTAQQDPHNPNIVVFLDIRFFAKSGLQPLNSTDIPKSLSLNDYDAYVNVEWTINGDAPSWIYTARIDSLNGISAVPEPETYAMLIIGLLLVGLAVRRSKSALSHSGTQYA